MPGRSGGYYDRDLPVQLRGRLSVARNRDNEECQITSGVRPREWRFRNSSVH